MFLVITFSDELVWETSLLSLMYFFGGGLITGVFNVNTFCLNDKSCSLNRVIYGVPFSFSDMRAYSGKSFFFFVTLLQSQISEKPKSFWKEIVTMVTFFIFKNVFLELLKPFKN